MAEHELISSITKSIYRDLGALSKPFLATYAVEVSKAGVPIENLQYAFWILFKGSKFWRVSTKEKNVLLTMRSLVSQVGDVPNFRDGFNIPDPEIEQKIDLALRKTADWVLKSLVNPIESIISRTLQKYTKDITVNGDKVRYLDELLRNYMQTESSRFVGGDLLSLIFSAIL